MRTAAQIIRFVLGDDGFADFSQARASTALDRERLWEVKLPLPRFIGIPTDWWFVLIYARDATLTASARQELLDSIRTESHTLLQHNRLMLVVSDARELHIADELHQEHERLFVVEIAEHSRPRGDLLPVNRTPFASSLRRKVGWGYIPRAIWPYQIHDNLANWRFFGRKRELAQVVESTDNIAIVGGRRIGKTSLLQAAHRKLKADGWDCKYVDAQSFTSSKDIIHGILLELSARDLHSAITRAKVLDEALLEYVLRKAVSRSKKVVLLVDELGRVLKDWGRDSWSFMGTLRKFNQTHGFRTIFTCFQEVFLAQQHDYTGAAVNFCTNLRLGTFTDEEVKGLVIGPLDLWKQLPEKDTVALGELILEEVGGHPYLLQAFCLEFFDHALSRQPQEILLLAKRLLRKDIHATFSAYMEEVFYNITDALPRYLFLKRCQQADLQAEPLRIARLDDQWIRAELAALRLQGTTMARRNVLIGMEMCGLTRSEKGLYDKQLIGLPIVYKYIKDIDPVGGEIERTLANLREDVLAEASKWHLTRLTEADIGSSV